MDELTRERYPHGVPYAELDWATTLQSWTRPEVIRLRRIVAAGTADMDVMAPGGDHRSPLRRRLLDAIRRWKA